MVGASKEANTQSIMQEAACVLQINWEHMLAKNRSICSSINKFWKKTFPSQKILKLHTGNRKAIEIDCKQRYGKVVKMGTICAE
jgi:hypothetical protein